MRHPFLPSSIEQVRDAFKAAIACLDLGWTIKENIRRHLDSEALLNPSDDSPNEDQILATLQRLRSQYDILNIGIKSVEVFYACIAPSPISVLGAREPFETSAHCAVRELCRELMEFAGFDYLRSPPASGDSRALRELFPTWEFITVIPISRSHFEFLEIVCRQEFCRVTSEVIRQSLEPDVSACKELASDLLFIHVESLSEGSRVDRIEFVRQKIDEGLFYKEINQQLLMFGYPPYPSDNAIRKALGRYCKKTGLPKSKGRSGRPKS